MATDEKITIEQFTADAHKFLAANAEPRESKKAFVWGEGSDNVSMFEERSKESEQEVVARAKKWRQQKFDAGFGWITGPVQYGGRGLSNEFEKAYGKVEAQFKVT
ncbi:MAG: hypothetical protein RI966_653, partial [Actinomycetota bacterium]